MYSSFLLRVVIVIVTTVGLVSPGHVAWAAGPAGTLRPTNAAATPIVTDVRLGTGGVLKGNVVDAQGVCAVRVDVGVRQAGGELAKTKTDQHGNFAFRGLRGGVYEIATGPTRRVVRAWAPQTAPPVAVEQVLVVTGQNVVLGQRRAGFVGHFWERSKYAMTNPLIPIGIVALAVGIPVIVNNKNKDSGS